MKTTLFIKSVVAGALMASFSCTHDILDITPSSFNQTVVYNDPALLKDVVTGVYIGIRHPFDDENSLLDGLTDNAYNKQGSGQATRFYTYGLTTDASGENVTRSLWQTAYTYIQKVNTILENTKTSSVDPAVLSEMSGELYFIRAFLYFDLLRWYGGVPIITKAYGLNETSYEVSRNSVDEVVTFVVQECDNAIAHLPKLADQESGRASQEAAMALKGRVLLYAASPLFNPNNDQSKWVAARDANKALLDLGTVQLVNTPEEYGDLFHGKQTKEIIFARYFTTINNQGWGVNTWLLSGASSGWTDTSPTQDLVDNYELVSGKLPAEDPAYDNQNPYVNRDPRFGQSILYQGAGFADPTIRANRAAQYFMDSQKPSSVDLSGKDSRLYTPFVANNSLTGYNFIKYSDPGKLGQGVGGPDTNTNPFIFFRIAEVYLNYAETQLALGNEGEARSAINTVRSRVGMPAVTESGPDLVQRYRRERRIELVLEDHRFFDIRRWKIGPEALNKPATGVIVINKSGDPTNLNIEYHYVDYAAGDGSKIPIVVDGDGTRKWIDRLYLLPIPPSEIQKSNGALQQNPGY